MHVLSIVEENPINDKRLNVEHETYKPSNEELNSFSLYLITFEVMWNDFPVPSSYKVCTMRIACERLSVQIPTATH